MYDYDGEPCYEPTLADEIMLEYQQKMKDALLETVKNNIEGIKQENERLKEENRKLQELVYGIQQRENSLEIEKSQFQRKLRYERLSELMGDFEVTMYRVDDNYVKMPKCSNCNKDRKIEFISPLGKKMTETCTCAATKNVYIVEEFVVTEFRIDRDGKQMLMWYEVKKDKDEEYDNCKFLGKKAKVYDEGANFEDLDVKYYNLYFKSKEQCQKYCDWLNGKEVSQNLIISPAQTT